MNNRKLFTKALSISLTAAMVLTMAPMAAEMSAPKSMKAPKESMIKVGQKKTITATRKSKKSTTDVKYVKFSPAKTKNIGISVKTSDDAVVSVEKISDGKYTYTGVNTGTATLTIKSRAKSVKGKKLTAKLAITVINPFSVKQKGAYTFTMSTSDKLEKVDKRDIKVVEEGSIVDNAVKEVKLSADKKEVEVKMEVPFIDQKKYEVTFGKEKGSFVASVGAPAAVNVKTQQVVQNKPTEIEYAVVDAKGMDVTDTLDKSKITVDVKVKTGYYDNSTKKLTLWKVGDTAEATVTYHSWNYDQKTGKEDVKEGKATITCVDKSSVVVTGVDKWTIADRVLSWNTDDMKSTIAAGKKAKIWVRMKKSDGTYVDNKDNAADFTFEPINTATLYAYSNGEVYANREGMEYVKVTYFDGTVKYQYTLPVTVGRKAEATSLVLSNPYVILSKDASVGTIITFKVLDQYGEAMDTVAAPQPEKVSGVDVATITGAGKNATGDIQKLSVRPKGEVGTGVYKLTFDKLSIQLTVQAQNVSAATAGYMLKADVTEIDTTIHKDTEIGVLNELVGGVKLNFVQTRAGLIDKDANDAFKTAKIKINGKEVPDNYNMITKESDGSLTFRTLVNGKAESASEKNYILLTNKSGGYTIEATAKIGDKTVTVSTFINVKNDTQMPKKDESYEINKINAADGMKYYDIIAQAVVDKTAPKYKAAHTLDSTTDIKKTGRVLALNKTKAVAAPDNGDDVDALSASQVYIDTAALPSFRLNGDNDVVWVVADRLNQEVKNYDAGVGIMNFKRTDAADDDKDKLQAVYGETKKFEGNLNLVSIKDKTGNLSLSKIYLKSDSNKTDVKAKFTNPKTSAANFAGGNVTFELTQKADTPIGVYVAEIKYTVGGKDYTQTAEFEIVKADITAIAGINLTATAAIADGEASTVTAVTVTTSPADATKALTAANVSVNKLKADGTTEAKTGNWATGETPVFIITVEAKDGYKFKSDFKKDNVAIGSNGHIQPGYSVTDAKVGNDGKLVITVKKDAAI